MTPAPRSLPAAAVVSVLVSVALALPWCFPSSGRSDADPFAEAASLAERWIHEDLEAGYKLASETGRPLLVAFR